MPKKYKYTFYEALLSEEKTSENLVDFDVQQEPGALLEDLVLHEKKAVQTQDSKVIDPERTDSAIAKA